MLSNKDKSNINKLYKLVTPFRKNVFMRRVIITIGFANLAIEEVTRAFDKLGMVLRNNEIFEHIQRIDHIAKSWPETEIESS